MSDRLLGYIVISALFIFLILPVSFLVWRSVIPLNSYIIEFPPINSVGFLNFQDPVYTRGVAIGQVRRVFNKKQKVYATIETGKTLSLYNDYRISVIPKGIMGDRYLEIEPGSDVARPVNPKDTLKGVFVMGPAEAIGYIDKLRSKIDQLSDLMKKLKNGTDENRSLISGFDQSIGLFDSLSSSIITLSGKIQVEAGQMLDSLMGIIVQSSLVTEKISSILPSFFRKVEDIIIQSNNLVVRLESISRKSVTMSEVMKEPDLFIWNNKLKNLQHELQNMLTIIDNLETEGLKIPVKLSGRRKR